jgi:serine/threonine protein kinase
MRTSKTKRSDKEKENKFPLYKSPTKKMMRYLQDNSELPSQALFDSVLGFYGPLGSTEPLFQNGDFRHVRVPLAPNGNPTNNTVAKIVEVTDGKSTKSDFEGTVLYASEGEGLSMFEVTGDWKYEGKEYRVTLSRRGEQDLFDALPFLNKEQRISALRQTVGWLHKLHTGQATLTGEPAAHCDVKLDNIAMVCDGNKRSFFPIDHGLANYFSQPAKMYGLVKGTPNYADPKVFERDGPNNEGLPLRMYDTWSVGVVAYVLVFREFPYREHFTAYEDLPKTFESETYKTNELLKDNPWIDALIRACLLTSSEAKRRTMQEIVELLPSGE